MSSDPVVLFADAMAERGLGCDGSIVADGQLHRYDVQGDKRGRKNGWYVLHLYPTPAGVYGSWKTGETHTWSLRGVAMDPAERQRHLAMLAQQRQERQAQRERDYRDAQQRAKSLWRDAKPALPSHAYLQRKGVGVWGVKDLNGLLVVPMRDEFGVMKSLQFIAADGAKRFLRGGVSKAVYHAIKGADGVRQLCVAEGYATGAAIREASGAAVAVAFSAGNLVDVAEICRRKFPDADIVIAADNDQETKNNPGVEAAYRAASAIGARVAVPRFANG